MPAFATRKSKVFTYNGSTGDTFPTATQTAALDRSTVGPVDYPVTGAKNADYIMGDQSGEGTAVGKLRVRDTVLGDIVGYGPDPEWCVERIMALAETAALLVLRKKLNDYWGTNDNEDN